MADAALPLVSVVMANRNGAAHVAVAVRSVLAQTESRLELILVDDVSTDDSIARAEAAAGGDPRLIVLRQSVNGGPAAARNRALAAARGTWIAVVDNDDAIHPDRLRRLVEAAEADKADIVADDLYTFFDDGSRLPERHLRNDLAAAPAWIGLERYIRSNQMNGPEPTLGYLKPVFRKAALDAHGLRYDERLRIAEDFDLVLRALAGGRKMRVYPEAGYYYRKHSASISHRLTPAHVLAMLDAADRFAAGHASVPGVPQAMSQYRTSLLDGLAFEKMLASLKARQIGGFVSAALGRPSALALFRYPIEARLARLKTPPVQPPPPPELTALIEAGA